MPKKRILAVEDDSVALEALRQILLQRGYEVATAQDGEKALAVLAAEPRFDLCILDVGLPGISGFDVCRRIRENPQFERLPVIFLTARGLLMDMAEGDDAGSDLYLVKPLLASKLVKMVEMFLSEDAPLARKPRSLRPE